MEKYFIAHLVREENILSLFISKSPHPDERCQKYSPLTGTVQGLIRRINRVKVV